MTTYSTAKPQFIEVGGTRYAYLRFGSTTKTDIPLVFLQHFRGTFDHWDPELIDPIAAEREVILIETQGSERAGGRFPQPTLAMNIPQIDLLGFSMGGLAAQMVALNAPPSLVRRLILAGTTPSFGEGLGTPDPTATPRLAAAANEEEAHDAFLRTFYSLTKKKQELGEKWWNRMTAARPDRSPYVGPGGTKAQLDAVVRWFTPEFASEGSYHRLHEITIPVLVANGYNDIIIPTVNSYVLFQRLVNADAHLHFFPDVGHGFLNEYADQFSKLINIFLDA
ncbi:Alpha/Beta hydrolase protein [Lipomyces kononenkoae]|uniref:Alpha/Beta hydrolase protein n=1 Tax=Lipomyces kononenkoae TaxID=34357 RepID=A0ACC3SRP3_LIPKO